MRTLTRLLTCNGDATDLAMYFAGMGVVALMLLQLILGA